MKLQEVVELLNCKIYTPDDFNPDYELNFAFGSDLMSDALMLLRTAPEEFFAEGMLLTGLVTNQSIRTAEMLDFEVVILVRGKTPNDNVYDAAQESGIIVIGTEDSMFTASGKLYAHGILGKAE